MATRSGHVKWPREGATVWFYRSPSLVVVVVVVAVAVAVAVIAVVVALVAAVAVSC